MDREQLKKIMKPIFKEIAKEAVKEVILESGVLSKIIIEVVTGLRGSLVVESRRPSRNSSTELQELSRIPKEKIEDAEVASMRAEARRELDIERNQKAQKMVEKTGMSKVFENLQKEQEIEEVPVKKTIKAPEITKEEIEDPSLTQEERQFLMEQKFETFKKRQREEKEDAKWGAKGGMALKGVAPDDPGININGILNIVGGKSAWLKRL